MNTHLRCCKNSPVFEIEYEIGTVYHVCPQCFGMKHFSRGIKSKKSLDLDSMPTFHNYDLDKSTPKTGAVVSE